MSSPRRVVIGTVVAVAVAALAGGWVVTHRQPTGLARVRAALEDDGRFVNGPTAGATLADASQWLFDDGRSCAAERGDDPRCTARLAAAAYTSVAAVGVATCTAPGVYRTRTAMLSYIGDIVSFDDRPLGTRRAPAPPRAPSC